MTKEQNRRRLAANAPAFPDRQLQSKCDECGRAIESRLDAVQWGEGLQCLTFCLPCGDPEEDARRRAAKAQAELEDAEFLEAYNQTALPEA